jgi:hypothetical protein
MNKLYTVTLKYFHLAIVEFLPVLKDLQSSTEDASVREKIDDLIEAYEDIDSKIGSLGLNCDDPNNAYPGEPYEVEIQIPQEMIENLACLSHRLLMFWKQRLERLTKKKYLTDANGDEIHRLEGLIWPLETFLKSEDYVLGKYSHNGPLVFPGEGATEVESKAITEVVKTIKSRLKTEDLFVETRSQGEDQHLLIGKRDGTPEKAHVIIDGITAEIRIEDNQKEPTDLIHKIESVLTLKDGRQIRTTREAMELSHENQKRPHLDLETHFSVSSNSEGNFLKFKVKNDGNESAVDVKAIFTSSSGEIGRIDVAHNISPNQTSSEINYRYTDTPLFRESLTSPQIKFISKSREGRYFVSGRTLIQDSRADGNHNIQSKPGDYFEE